MAQNNGNQGNQGRNTVNVSNNGGVNGNITSG